jgi:hypothetical protein
LAIALLSATLTGAPVVVAGAPVVVAAAAKVGAATSRNVAARTAKGDLVVRATRRAIAEYLTPARRRERWLGDASALRFVDHPLYGHAHRAEIPKARESVRRGSLRTEHRDPFAISGFDAGSAQWPGPARECNARASGSVVDTSRPRRNSQAITQRGAPMYPQSFDPIPRLAAVLHDTACDGHPANVPDSACFLARAAAEAHREILAAAGLAIAPTEVVRWMTTALDDAANSQPETAFDLRNPSEVRARAQVFIQKRLDGGGILRDGPYERWFAELVMGDLAAGAEPGVRSSLIVPEPDWIGELLGTDFGERAA